MDSTCEASLQILKTLTNYGYAYLVCSVGSKIIRALVIIRVSKFIANAVLWNICQIMIFRLYTASNKHGDKKKKSDQTREKLQVLSQSLY